jgi:hypothetical protein
VLFLEDWLSENAMSALDHQLPAGASGASPAMGRQAAADYVLSRRIGLILAAITSVGLAVRIGCAQGPLWLDEIWSIENLGPLTHFWQVFWGISHDNNHFLNSLWLYWATRFSADAVVLRAPSIAMGALTIAMMGRLGARHSAAAAIAASAMTALSYFFVNYSVEARGYAGSALALVVGFDALERSIARPDSRARFTLAAAMGIGLLWHLAILPAIALLALICFGEERRKIGRWESALAATIRIFAPTLAAIVPALAFVLAGVFVVGRFTIGGVRAFDAAQALGAIAAMARDTIGLPLATPGWAVLVLAAAAIFAALRLRLVLDGRRVAYAIILLALPAAVFVIRPPNAHIPRYYLICALFLILFIAEVFGSLWRAGARRRWGAVAALAAILIGDVGLLVRFQASKDQAWPQALAAISDSGRLRLASNFDDRIGKFVDYYNRAHPPLDLVARAQWCQRRPDWLIAETSSAPEMPENLDLQANGCRVQFAFVRRYESWGLSSVGWALYRAQ